MLVLCGQKSTERHDDKAVCFINVLSSMLVEGELESRDRLSWLSRQCSLPE